MTRTVHRWATPLGRWVADYGAGRLAHDVGLAVHGTPLAPVCIYQWLAGTHEPRPAHARQIVRLSRGAVSFSDVYSVRAAVAAKMVATDRPGRAIPATRDPGHVGKP
ncbi:MAG: hypothetical protein AAB290_02950 [Candidatus Eisenbacteria bacterium]